MRQRKIKNLDEKLALRSRYIIEEPESLKGRWSERTGGRPLMMEIGCGKGKFISEKAAAGGEYWLGIEGHRSVALHALEKAEALGLTNVGFILSYVNSLEDLFEDGEVAGIFLNFSDPWPKDRHEKRRLTTGRRLMEYARVLADDGVLEFKTDNDGLFEYTLGEVEKQDELELVEMTRDLHGAGNVGREKSVDSDGGCEEGSDELLSNAGSEHATREGVVTTEYEEKFAAEGKNINFLKLVKR